MLLTAQPGQSGSGVALTATGNIGTTLLATSLSDVALALSQEINSTDWWTTNAGFPLRSFASGNTFSVTSARYGLLSTSGTAVTWVSGTRFTGILPGSTITIAGILYTVAAVNGPASLTLTASAGSQTSARYVADCGGIDGNMIQLYLLNKTPTLTAAQTTVRLSGGSSAATWRCTLDFTALGIDMLRQCWLTFAPALADSAAFTTTEWQATFSNWSLTDPNNVCTLSVAGPNSVRVEEDSTACTFTGNWVFEEGFFSGGGAVSSKTTNDSVTVRYSCTQTHELYLGTSLYPGRCTKVGVRLDGDTETVLNCSLVNEPAVNTRRHLRGSVAPGTHTVTLRVLDSKPFYFDFIEAAVLSDIPAPPPARSQLSPALDYSTDHSWKLPPARILWIFNNLGFAGPVNQYIGIFWWNQRTNPTAVFPSLTVAFNGTWAAGDTVQLNFGTVLAKTVFPQDTTATIAAHFAAFINGTLIGAWASASGNVLTVTLRSPAYSFTFSQSFTSAAGTVTAPSAFSAGSVGAWIVDPTQSPALNRGARDWHSDLYAECRSRNREVVTSGSMELVHPPDSFVALYPDGQPVTTANNLDGVYSLQCSPGSLMRAYQCAMFDCITDLQNAAGLVPGIQFGEYLWWFFTNYSATHTQGGMAFFDAETTAAAQTALGRPLHRFLGPNDDPSVNASADAIFLRNRLRDHVAAIGAHVRSRYPAAQLEMLFAADVNYPVPAGPVGGALNHFINFPVEWGSHTTAGFHRLKVEALSFGASRNLDLARTAVQFPLTLDWPLAAIRYLVPIFVHSCPWEKELAMAFAAHIPVINLWAFDQMCIFGLQFLAVRNQARSASQG